MRMDHTTRLTKETLDTYCREQLSRYYPAGIPVMAEERLAEELVHMKRAKSEETILLYHRLSQAAVRSGHILEVDGISVSSFLVFLLGNGRINPLPAHYYCTKCGQYEVAPNVKFGLDLSEKTCPACGEPMRRDGFSLPCETVWRYYHKPLNIEYRSSLGFRNYGYETIRDYFADRTVLPFGSVNQDEPPRLMEAIGAAILPEGKNAEDYPQYMAYLADGTPCISGDRYYLKKQGIELVLLMESLAVSSLHRIQQHIGAFSGDIDINELQKVSLRELRNTALVSKEECVALNGLEQSYFDMACALSAAHNTYELDGAATDFFEIRKVKAFQNCPIYSREDVFDCLLSGGWDRHQAEKAMEFVWLGKAFRMPETLEELQLPEALRDAARHCRYLFPRGSGAQRLVLLMQMVWYLRKNPAAYYAALNEKKER